MTDMNGPSQGDAAPVSGPDDRAGAGVPAPEVWPAFVGFAAMCFLGLVGTVLLAVVIAVVLVARGMEQGEIQGFFGKNLLAQIFLGSPFQVAGVVVALVGARVGVARRDRPLRDELGLRRPPHGLSRAEWAMVLVGSGVPFVLSLLAATPMPSMGSPDALVEAWRTMSPATAVVWVLYIGLVPGFCEELFFRGFVQRRLLAARWSPPVAIGVTSVLFALLHIDPPAMALALVLGVWLGFLAWRTGSTWPGIAVHVTINSTWNLMQIVFRRVEVREDVAWAAAAAFGVASLVCFVVMVRRLWKRPPVGA